MEEEDLAASMVAMITRVDGEMMDKDNSMNKECHNNITIAEGMGTQKLIVGIKINK